MTAQPSRRRVPTLTEPGSVGRWVVTAGRWAQPITGRMVERVGRCRIGGGFPARFAVIPSELFFWKSVFLE